MEEDNLGMMEGEMVELDFKYSQTRDISMHALVGRVMTSKFLNKKTAQGMIMKSWGNPEGLEIIDFGKNTFLFNFKDFKTSQRIYDEGPWNILGSLLCLRRWVPEFTVFEIPFVQCPFWIQIHGVPLEGISKENATKIGSKLGEVLDVEEPIAEKRITRDFMRVRVSIDITKPLVTGFWVPRKELPKVWVMLYYERLQDYCYNCGRIGHDQKECKHERVMSLIKDNAPRYGPGLGVSPLRPLTPASRWDSDRSFERRASMGQQWYGNLRGDEGLSNMAC